MSQNLSVKYSQTFIDHVKNLQQIHLKLLQREWFKKQQMQQVIWFIIKLQIKLRGSQKIHNKIIQRHLKMSTINKHLKKDVSPAERPEIIGELRLK